MRLTTVRAGEGTAAGRVEGDQITLLPVDDVGALIASRADWREVAADCRGTGTLALAEADFAPLVLRPEKIIGVGVNYRAHAEEAGLTTPPYPTLFAMFSRSLIGANDDLVIPANSQMVDFEVELGVVVGTELRHVDPEQALAGVAGYTIVNDVSMRDWQLRTGQFLQGKTFEASTPVGPYLVTPDEIDASDLRQRCLVDGEVMQDGSTADMIFGVGEVLAYVSEFITLAPGDLIAMGTPAGIGGARRPPVFLTPGMTLTSAIDGLGEQCNRCLAPVLAPAA